KSDSTEWSKNLGFDFHYPLVSRSPKIKEIFKLIKKVAKSNATILIHGETGTGKELIASLIQFISHRSDKPFVKVNCAALPESLLESELFGHEKGAFTGAIQTRIGKFEQADGGTIFLDEIGDMHLTTQAKILRVLQDQTFSRIGGNGEITVDARIIAATNKDLLEEIERENFRADLYYRLNVVTLNVPPLRNRREDILLIADYFRIKFSQEVRKDVTGFSDETKALLQNHSWRGNIRELKNLIERSVLVADEGEMITARDLAMTGKDYFAAGGRDRRKNTNGELISFDTLDLETIEKETILRALQVSEWIQKDAANLLGISPRALNYKINQYDITHPTWKKNTSPSNIRPGVLT
ncbi:sigma-54-dependent Fis family transcriptional regulator, partial [candidate division KSB1 bacterium]|nr:sigma-54-dependent Fis family transcriptional regulator [candidate division KSB1 bacterium]NIR70298.1 sigma-54-dependent Fis family transcriptional regulator [candidate division KSB1 bacterium]NIS24459.1 sigma-54-dependent Fis family transcriptional regulator [candidate division KSB1 bacterium]NIT71395.1 sigma-54-dependent Fis family transcriptional regulator [candidate division KSB1 bacterium]NIU25079.1 sigma-54-dependent Fis family transcriptional regulator [candidate division KSB1 bacteri